MKAARTRIGRIRLKAGGVELRVLPRKVLTGNPVVEHLRGALISTQNMVNPPDAYFLVTLRFDPQAPGQPFYDVQFCSQHDSLPLAHLAEIGAAILKSEAISWRSEVRTMESLGYAIDDWTPDPEAA